MKKQKRVILTLVIIFIVMLFKQNVFAFDAKKYIKNEEVFTEKYKKYIELNEEEKKKILIPTPYKIEDTEVKTKNLFRLTQPLGAGISDTKYSLATDIPDNVEIKNQGNTGLCWDFASIAALETNLALKDFKANIATPKKYDFSEKHMYYASSKNFLNNQKNKYGYDMDLSTGGDWLVAKSYFVNGMGAVNESDMQFDGETGMINIEDINKPVQTTVYDTYEYPEYSVSNASEAKTKIKQQIVNNGAVFAAIHGAKLDSDYCNINTGAIYCNDTEQCPVNHAVAIIGWDDNYEIENFNQNARPLNKGAWIIKNSWGKEYDAGTTEEVKQSLFNQFKTDLGLTDISQFTDEMFTQVINILKWVIRDNKVYIPIGENGIMYVSYEDVNVYSRLRGIQKAVNEVDYENLYQYNELYAAQSIPLQEQKLYLANVFSKKTSGKELITRVAFETPEACTCKVYVNPNGSSKNKSDLISVTLEAGESETISEAGYHSLEFANPVEITGNEFVVAIEIQSARTTGIKFFTEVNVSGTELADVTVESNKCFWSVQEAFDQNPSQWADLNQSYVVNTDDGTATILPGDSTIKAFTVSNVEDDSLDRIEITTMPTKTQYYEGQNFEPAGMVVTAYFNNGTSTVLASSDYEIINGTELNRNNPVTIKYGGKTKTVPITILENSVTGLAITNPPSKTNYNPGENFDNTGMVVSATYADGTTKPVTDYTVTNGNNIKNNQTSVTIKYGEQTATQNITVRNYVLKEIKIATPPTKVRYVVGQNFNPDGMVVKATYGNENDTTSDYDVTITEYTVEGGENLTTDKTQVTIKYEGKQATQNITVVEKAIEKIEVSKLPTKVEYVQKKDTLDLTGGKIKITYNDDTTEEIDMTNEQVTATGFSNIELGKVTITLTYLTKTTTFDVTVIEGAVAKNSNMDSAKAIIVDFNVVNDDIIYELEIRGVNRVLTNDSVEYYYCLSPRVNEETDKIDNWLKVTKAQTSGDKVVIQMKLSDMKKFSEIIGANEIYLYVKEVAIKGADQKIAYAGPLTLENGITDEQIGAKIDEYLATYEYQYKDKTTATKVLPNTGVRTIIIAVSVIIIAGVIIFIRYKKLSKYV